jgi:hypothetical protein
MGIERPQPEKTFNKEETLRILNEQFEHPETIEIDGEKLEIYDLQPPQTKTDIPLMIVPGWSATPIVLKENMITLAELGRRVIAVKSAHGIETPADDAYPLAELRKTAALMKGMENKQINQADAVSHSEAGIFMTIGAVENSDKFRNLVLVSPAGLIGRDTLPRLTKDFSLDIAGQMVKALFKKRERLGIISRAMWEATKAIIDSPKKTWEEIKAMVDFQIPELLAELKKDGHGISIVHGIDDKAFPIDRMKKIVTDKMVDQFLCVRGSHNEMYLDPTNFSKTLDLVLDEMEAKHNKKINS